jgi:hypothetical protein
MMNIEVDDGYTPGTVDRPGMERRGCDVIEQAEAAGPCLLGMMAGRPHSAKRVLGPALHHFIDRENARARGV